MTRNKIQIVKRDDIVYSSGLDLISSDGMFKLGDGRMKRIMSVFRLLQRFTRTEINNCHYTNDNALLIVAKKGIYRITDKNKIKKTFAVKRGSKPLNICVVDTGLVIFGEYFQNLDKKAVHIYKSSDYGKNWEIAYTFDAGNINHVHGVYYDKFTGRIWVATGDRENECIIGYTEDEFKSFTEVFRGGQEYRTCQLFFYKDFIVFGTDTQYEQNVIKKFDRQTLEITELQKVQGSVIKGGQVGDVSFISTTVEPSDVNTDKWAHLWVTKDGLHWEERYKAKKDWLPATLFQFGTFEFPQYYGIEKLERLYFSGRALKGLDGKTTYIDL